MAFRRRTGSRFEANIWPGFVDAMTALLLVLMFVLTIFMIVQFVLRETITGQDKELDEYSAQVAALADTLGLEQQRAEELETDLVILTDQLSEADAAALAQAALVKSLLAQNEDMTTSITQLQEQRAEQMSEADALKLALARARSEIDLKTEEARLAAARREALEALVQDLEVENTGKTEALTAAEQARMVDTAAAEALRTRLAESTAELSAMTLSLEAERRRAEETLTLLAAARLERDTLAAMSSDTLTEADRRRALLAQATEALNKERQIATESQRQVELMTQQTARLRQELNELQGLLNAARQRDELAKAQIETLGTDLNTALSQVALEQQRRAEMDEAERVRLEAEAKDLQRYRSEFFGRVREVLGDREGVQIVGDRFVFDSEVLFDRGSAALGAGGRQQIAAVAALIREVAGEIPEEIDWILRVDGHTDKIPLAGTGAFRDNWELSQGRALSVVKFLIDSQGIEARRLAATGFGEFQPVDTGDTQEALARNRRIELKFTER